MQYRICPLCKAHLDPGERCDCRNKEEAAPQQPERPQARTLNVNIPCEKANVKDGMSTNG